MRFHFDLFGYHVSVIGIANWRKLLIGFDVMPSHYFQDGCGVVLHVPAALVYVIAHRTEDEEDMPTTK